MKVALHSAPEGFFKSKPPYTGRDLCRLVQKAASLGFECFQVGPLNDFVDIDSQRLRSVLDKYNMERNVHVGGRYDAEKFAVADEQYKKARKEIHYGIELCREITSVQVSFHPPFFTTRKPVDKSCLSKVKTRFLELVRDEVKFACSNGVKIALESFCYYPFIFTGLRDFLQFVSVFPSEELGVILEVGHLYQAGFNLDEAIRTFRNRLLDVHVHDATLDEDYRKATHLPIGEGNVNFRTLIRMLSEAKYYGWLTLEIRGNEKEILESREFLESLIE